MSTSIKSGRGTASALAQLSRGVNLSALEENARGSSWTVVNVHRRGHRKRGVVVEEAVDDEEVGAASHASVNSTILLVELVRCAYLPTLCVRVYRIWAKFALHHGLV